MTTVYAKNVSVGIPDKTFKNDKFATVLISLRRPTLFLESHFNLWHSSAEAALLCLTARGWHAVSGRLIFMKL